ncbi:PAS domain S-box protein [Ktedonobacter sp. SOSP1-52]|uniref:PAS domain S-box protein n=1 Tax=Ktedonobacter sp. SOSP1-52 TaxID=2778366 RepID=UPI0019160B8D|nr:PAS domain S-box protein [Ktedonobacter sp. SOSP1-52]
MDQAGTILTLNERLAALFGYTEEELRGAPIEILLPVRVQDVHRRKREQYTATPRVRPMGVGLELYGMHKDGTEFPVDISLRPFLLEGAFCTLGAVRDMTEQHAAQRQRAAQALNLKLLTDLLNLVPHALSLRDPLGRTIYWNEGAERLYGWAPRDAVGRLLHTLLETQVVPSWSAHSKHQGHWEGEAMQTCHDRHCDAGYASNFSVWEVIGRRREPVIFTSPQWCPLLLKRLG